MRVARVKHAPPVFDARIIASCAMASCSSRSTASTPACRASARPYSCRSAGFPRLWRSRTPLLCGHRRLFVRIAGLIAQIYRCGDPRPLGNGRHLIAEKRKELHTLALTGSKLRPGRLRLNALSAVKWPQRSVKSVARRFPWVVIMTRSFAAQ